MIQNVRTHGGMDSGGECNFQLGAYTVGASHQNRIAPALAVKLEERAKPAHGRQHATAKCFPRHCGDPALDAVSYRDIYSSIGIAHEMNLLPEGGRVELENMKQALPAHFARMDYGVEVRLKSFADVPGLPDIFRGVDGHVNHQRCADNILARNETPVAAVVGILAVVAHH